MRPGPKEELEARQDALISAGAPGALHARGPARGGLFYEGDDEEDDHEAAGGPAS